MRTRVLFIILAIVLVSYNSCSVTDDDPGSTEIKFLLTDSPGEYQEVNIDIFAVHVIINDSVIELETNQGIYNILEFVNGRDTLLVEDEIPSGYLSQIRLILAEINTVMIDSVRYGLKTPSAQQSGLKLNVHQEFLPGIEYEFVIDFEADKSIVKTGKGKYILKPVIRVFSEATSGSIEGTIQPANARPLIMAINETDTSSTYADTASGGFMIRGLTEGLYSLEIHPVEAFNDSILTGIEVLAGQITLIDTIHLQ